MTIRADADASPEKRLFISLITRDISLRDAIIDLTDNSVNAAMRPLQSAFASSKDFVGYLAKGKARSAVKIVVTYDKNHITVEDDAEGIEFSAARNEVFRFGHSEDHKGYRDRLSVYGIGMKRALFKIGNRVSIKSDHHRGGFELELNVADWETKKDMPWTFPITKRSPRSSKTGTKIVIRELHDEILKRLSEPKFNSDLAEKISKVYSYFLGRVIKISVNGDDVPGAQFEFGSNFSHDRFKSNGVDCTITAGIGAATGDVSPAISSRFE